MPSAERRPSCTMVRKERSRSCEAGNGCVGERERLGDEGVRDTFSDWSQRNIHDCYPAVACRVKRTRLWNKFAIGRVTEIRDLENVRSIS